MAQVTRLGAIAIPRPPYGSFAGKASTDTAKAGWPDIRLVILPDGRRFYLTLRQIAELRQRLERPPPEEPKREKKKPEPLEEIIAPIPAMIQVTGEAPILIPPAYQAPGLNFDRIADILSGLLEEEEEMLILLMLY